jgi:hypothetical protein
MTVNALKMRPIEAASFPGSGTRADKAGTMEIADHDAVRSLPAAVKRGFRAPSPDQWIEVPVRRDPPAKIQTPLFPRPASRPRPEATGPTGPERPPEDELS